MEIHTTDEFFESAKKTFDPNIFGKIENLYYNIKWSILNQFRYFKITSKMRPWDYIHILDMMKFQLKLLHKSIEKYSNEVDEDKNKILEKINRAIFLINNHVENNYIDRSGYIHDAINIDFIKDGNVYKMIHIKNDSYPNYNENEVFDNANKLQKAEWDELFNILKNDLESFWY